MRKIRHIVNFSRWRCWSDVGVAHQRLDEAFELMSGLQQPAHPDSEESAKLIEEEHARGMQEVYDCIDDITTAVTDRSVSYEKKRREALERAILESYAYRSNVPFNVVSSFVVLPCPCAEEGCYGFQVVSKEVAENLDPLTGCVK